MSDEMKKAVVRAAAVQAAGSAFMHGSQTTLGNSFDTKGQSILPLLSHQVAIAQLPAPYNTNTVLRDMNLEATSKTGIEQMDILTETIASLPAEDWNQIIKDKIDGDLTKSLAPIIASILSLVLPETLVDDICDLIAKFIGSFTDPKDVVFLKDHYIPLFRNATSGLRAKLGPLKKIEIAKTGIGGWMKFMYYTLWQEQIINATTHKILLNPYVNELGAKLMPKVFSLADKLSGFADTDSAVKTCADDVYPGAGWCRKDIPHAKSHEIAANAFYDLVALGEYLGGLYKMEGHELEVFEAEAQSRNPREYESQAMLWEAVMTGLGDAVHGMAAMQDKAEQGSTVQFWQLMAAGALLICLVLLGLVGVLLSQLRALHSQCSPTTACRDPAEVGAYTKLVSAPRHSDV